MPTRPDRGRPERRSGPGAKIKMPNLKTREDEPILRDTNNPYQKYVDLKEVASALKAIDGESNVGLDHEYYKGTDQMAHRVPGPNTVSNWEQAKHELEQYVAAVESGTHRPDATETRMVQEWVSTIENEMEAAKEGVDSIKRFDEGMRKYGRPTAGNDVPRTGGTTTTGNRTGVPGSKVVHQSTGWSGCLDIFLSTASNVLFLFAAAYIVYVLGLYVYKTRKSSESTDFKKNKRAERQPKQGKKKQRQKQKQSIRNNSNATKKKKKPMVSVKRDCNVEEEKSDCHTKDVATDEIVAEDLVSSEVESDMHMAARDTWEVPGVDEIRDDRQDNRAVNLSSNSTEETVKIKCEAVDDFINEKERSGDTEHIKESGDIEKVDAFVATNEPYEAPSDIKPVSDIETDATSTSVTDVNMQSSSTMSVSKSDITETDLIAHDATSEIDKLRHQLKEANRTIDALHKLGRAKDAKEISKLRRELDASASLKSQVKHDNKQLRKQLLECNSKLKAAQEMIRQQQNEVQANKKACIDEVNTYKRAYLDTEKNLVELKKSKADLNGRLHSAMEVNQHMHDQLQKLQAENSILESAAAAVRSGTKMYSSTTSYTQGIGSGNMQSSNAAGGGSSNPRCDQKPAAMLPQYSNVPRHLLKNLPHLEAPDELHHDETFSST